MLYNEFLSGTGCRDNAKNYKVYRDLEVMYMNSNLSKEDIYEYGKKLVDNSLSESELAAIKANERSIEFELDYIEIYENEIKLKKELIEHFPDDRSVKGWKDEIKRYRIGIEAAKDRIRFLKRSNKLIRANEVEVLSVK